ncbi:MAG: hypothetical protein WC736_14640 [Gallionella sp.]|jgi:hypothetical protein
MDALFETTVEQLVEVTTRRIEELRESLVQKRVVVFARAKACNSFDELIAIVGAHREREEDSALHQYEENLEYLLECDKKRVVFLNQTEWRHYFHGAPRPELC